MVTRLMAVVVVLGLASCAVAATSTTKLPDGRSLVVSAATIDVMGPGSTTLVLTNKACIKIFDKAAGSTFDARADKIVIFLSGASDAKPSDGIKSADLVGSPCVVYETQDPATGKPVKTIATSNAASYDGPTETVHLKGNVKITNENPSIFEGPAEMMGDDATIRFGEKLGPNDVRFRISSSPGVSTITATPKATGKTNK